MIKCDNCQIITHTFEEPTEKENLCNRCKELFALRKLKSDVDQDRRRRVFEQVALDTLEKMRLGMFQCEIQDFESNLAANIGEVADWIIVQQDIFGSKVQGEK